ncbi:hypothetical protein SCLCIDRAFT_983036 [Scleroderma citrinum Foug A]|uniref:Uncharacterized protein n=1 Tax=Scleroderma citrinum Foug A TaxID=1036808 RepID=A0A0C3DV42_9AGAM|nr:hypothetical protein SCLCIDRAFT_983036 [Scleroderma citrinum Foug A]
MHPRSPFWGKRQPSIELRLFMWANLSDQSTLFGPESKTKQKCSCLIRCNLLMLQPGQLTVRHDHRTICISDEYSCPGPRTARFREIGVNFPLCFASVNWHGALLQPATVREGSRRETLHHLYYFLTAPMTSTSG